jgi:hypothetical protein
MATNKEIYERMQKSYLFLRKRQGKVRELADDRINAVFYAVAAELEKVERELLKLKEAQPGK